MVLSQELKKSKLTRKEILRFVGAYRFAGQQQAQLAKVWLRHHAAVDIPDVHPQPKDLPFLQTLDAFAFQVTHFLDLRMPVTEKMKRWIIDYGIDIDAVRRELAYSPFRRDQYVALSHLGYEKAIQVLDSEAPILSSPPDFIREESFICNLETLYGDRPLEFLDGVA